MKRVMILLAASVILASSSTAQACGYGAYDPDVETALSGDPVQATLAIQRILQRGCEALEPVQQYRQVAARQHRDYQNYLQKLLGGNDFGLDEQQKRAEIQRVNDFLIGNEQRLRQLDRLVFQLGGRDFAGESWVWPGAIG